MGYFKDTDEFKAMVGFSNVEYRDAYRKYYRDRNRRLYPLGVLSVDAHERVCRVCGVRKSHERFVWYWHEKHPLQWKCRDCLNARTLANKYARLGISKK